MRVNITRKPDRTCALCGQPLVVGTPGVQLSVGFLWPVRTHVECANRWRYGAGDRSRRTASLSPT